MIHSKFSEQLKSVYLIQLCMFRKKLQWDLYMVFLTKENLYTPRDT